MKRGGERSIKKGGIAFFDSGIGGLTVLNECRKYISNDIFYYYGDNKNAPYGNLSEEKIKGYVEKAFKKFVKLRVRAVVLACNTVTAVCVEDLRKRYNFPIIGAEPAIVKAAQLGGRVLTLATKATCNSKRFLALCEKTQQTHENLSIQIFPCENLARDIELHLYDKTFDFTKTLPQCNPTSVVLGCTHYIYIEEKIKRFYRCPIYNGNDGIAKRLVEILHLSTGKSKIRDRRPLLDFFIKKTFYPTTHNHRKQKGKNTNKCSWLHLMKYRRKNGRIYFIGSGKKRNKSVFEHTFAFLL